MFAPRWWGSYAAERVVPFQTSRIVVPLAQMECVARACMTSQVLLQSRRDERESRRDVRRNCRRIVARTMWTSDQVCRAKIIQHIDCAFRTHIVQ